jgi:hypothetical protein
MPRVCYEWRQSKPPQPTFFGLYAKNGGDPDPKPIYLSGIGNRFSARPSAVGVNILVEDSGAGFGTEGPGTRQARDRDTAFRRLD